MAKSQENKEKELKEKDKKADIQEEKKNEKVFEFKATDEQKADAPSQDDEKFLSLNNQYIRLQADFENYKKRNAVTAQRMYTEGVEEVIVAVLPTMDFLDMAISSQKDESQRKGIELVKKNLQDTLQKFGVEEMVALGEEFDPNLHEAVMNRDDAENAGKIVEVVKKGYKRGDLVLRHPMVVVGQ